MSPQANSALTCGVFTVTYVGLAIGKYPRLRMDRAGIAFVGAAAMLATGVLTITQAVSPESIDYETIFLLFSMMVVVGVLRISGFFAQLAHGSLDRIKSPRVLLVATIALAGVLSAFLVNDIVCLALTPLVIHVARRLRFDPTPHLIGLATAANIGSAGTITGNPQNMIIGVHSHISYARFAAHLFPVAMIGLLVDCLVLAWVYRRRLAMQPDSNVAPRGRSDFSPRATRSLAHGKLRRKALTISIIAVALFLVGANIATVAVCAAAVLLIERIRPERIYRQIDWSLLVMFVSLFVVVHAFDVEVVSHWGIERWHALLTGHVALLSIVSASLSNLVSNVPAVMLFDPLMRTAPQAAQQKAWLPLAMSSTFAGNLTTLGSVANLIVVENARREGVLVSFREYCQAGIPVTLLTLALGIAWLKFVQY